MPEWRRQIADRFADSGHHPDLDIVEELGQHAAAAYESARAEGLGADEATARVEALIEAWTADAARLKHRSRRRASIEPPSARTGHWTGVLHDLRYAWRVSWRTPGPALVAAATMALGIAATSILFSVVWGVLLKPLPWADADRLIRMQETREGATRSYGNAMTNGAYLAWQPDPQTIDALGAYAASTLTLTGAGDPQRVRVTSATASLFDVLRAVPVRGALFTAEDEPASSVAVISHALWQRQFGGAEDVVGKTVTFDGKVRTIAGVMSPDFVFPDRETVAWIPYTVRPSRTADGGSRVQLFYGIARLRPGVTPQQAAAEATARARSAPDPGLAMMALFGSKGAPILRADRLLDAATADVSDALWVLLGAVGLLLITATANIASVQLARAASRRREFAIRVSLGASGARLARQLVFESLFIGLLGAAAGLALTFAVHGSLPSLLPPDFPRVSDIAIDWRVVAVSGLAALGSSLIVGIVPAVQARRLAPRSAMAEDVTSTGTAFTRSSTARLRAGIMAGQVAVACVLLVGAGLLGRTFIAMLKVDRGYDPANVLTASIATPEGLFTAPRRTALVERTLARLRAHPDVLAAATVNNLPLLPGESMMALTLPPAPGQSEGRNVQTGVRLVSPGYFDAMGIDVLAGRPLGSQDTATSMPSVVVNRAFAERYLSSESIGSRLPLSLYDGKRDWELVGIVDNVRMRGSLTEAPGPELYVSYPQTPQGITAPPIVVIRTRNDPAGMMDGLRRIVHAEEPAAALESMMTMEDRVMGSLARPRLYAVVLAGFAAFAVTIAAVGLFGVLSYSVAQRSRELGVRAALGARPGQIVRMVVREGLVISSLGITAGLTLAMFASRLLSSFLYGVSPIDGWSYLAVTGILLAIGALACALPARRAGRVDPLVVLKSS
jgi:putative ABC transport system permease protein